jgi:hypothetical protein
MVLPDRYVPVAIPNAVKPGRRLRETKKLSDLSNMQSDILMLKPKPHPLMAWVDPNFSIEHSDPLLNISATESQQRI